MTALAAILFLAALALAGWSYLVYPRLVRRLASKEPAPAPASMPSPRAPSVEVLVTAADEEAGIAARVRDLLAQETDGPYRVSIGCDGSADATADRAREAGDERVSVTAWPARRGKASVLNDLVSQSTADVLVFTDANTRFDPGAVRELCRVLASPGTAVACGRLVLETPGGGGRPTPESEFWDRETALKEAEGGLGLCLGANGAIYAAWRSDVSPLPPDTTSMDDFLIPLGALRRGRAVRFARGAVAREASARDALAEASRRFRIGIGAGQVLRRQTWLWNAARRPRLTLLFFSRKAARWLAPVLVLLAAAVALGSPPLRPFGAAVLVAAGLAAATLRLRLAPPGLPGRLYYFAVINLALASGVFAGLFGGKRPVWKPVARS